MLYKFWSILDNGAAHIMMNWRNRSTYVGGIYRVSYRFAYPLINRVTLWLYKRRLAAKKGV